MCFGKYCCTHLHPSQEIDHSRYGCRCANESFPIFQIHVGKYFSHVLFKRNGLFDITVFEPFHLAYVRCFEVTCAVLLIQNRIWCNFAWHFG